MFIKFYPDVVNHLGLTPRSWEPISRLLNSLDYKNNRELNLKKFGFSKMALESIKSKLQDGRLILDEGLMDSFYMIEGEGIFEIMAIQEMNKTMPYAGIASWLNISSTMLYNIIRKSPEKVKEKQEKSERVKQNFNDLEKKFAEANDRICKLEREIEILKAQKGEVINEVAPTQEEVEKIDYSLYNQLDSYVKEDIKGMCQHLEPEQKKAVICSLMITMSKEVVKSPVAFVGFLIKKPIQLSSITDWRAMCKPEAKEPEEPYVPAKPMKSIYESVYNPDTGVFEQRKKASELSEEEVLAKRNDLLLKLKGGNRF